METPETLRSCLICGDSRLSSSNNCFEKHSSEFGTLEKFMGQLGLKGRDLSEVKLCDNCHSGVVKATEWRGQVGEMERDVRSLQRIILKMMRQLQSLQGNYLEEMKKLERKINKKDNKTGMRKGKRTNKSTSITTTICQGIRTVVRELSVFQNSISTQQRASATPNVAQQRTFDPEIPDTDNLMKTEPESFPHFNEASAEENCMQVPMFTENDDDQIDIELGIYSQDTVQVDPLSLEETAITSPLKSCKPQKKHGPCQYCGKVFDSRSKLRDHIYTHTGEGPFKCEVCSMAFTTSTTLKRHLMMHTGKKPFTCSQCQKSFYRKDALANHKLLHSEKKPFSCPVCGMGFVERRRMVNHIKREHPASNYNTNQ